MGTAHLLEAVRQHAGVRAVVVISSDKCYENREWVWGYREPTPWAGTTPTRPARAAPSWWSPPTAAPSWPSRALPWPARAGNVIGGGDWTPPAGARRAGRLRRGRPVTLRQPGAIRPWQHAGALRGYLVLAQKLYEEGAPWADGWNFGPRPDDAKSVAWVVGELARAWGPARWASEASPSRTKPTPSSSTAARPTPAWAGSRAGAPPPPCNRLCLAPRLAGGADMRQHTLDQITEFENAA
jgi:CDP-glucose 4,6-dehydratase